MTNHRMRLSVDHVPEFLVDLDDDRLKEVRSLDELFELYGGTLNSSELFEVASCFFRIQYARWIMEAGKEREKHLRNKDILDAQSVERQSAVEAFRAPFRQALARHGVHGGPELLAKGSRWFINTDFPPFGHGALFGAAILERPLHHVSRESMHEMIDKLGMQGNYLEIMQQAGIPDYNTLHRKGRDWFLTLDFPPVGKGKKLVNQVLGKSYASIPTSALRLIAIKVGLPLIAPETITEYRRVLEAKGVVDKTTLFKKGSKWFMRNEFGLYGHGNLFAGIILSRHVGRVTHQILDEICHVLRFSELDSVRVLMDCCDTLAEFDVRTREDLIERGVQWLKKTSFPPYGKGGSFARLVLGKPTRLSTSTVLEMADKLFPVSPKE